MTILGQAKSDRRRPPADPVGPTGPPADWPRLIAARLRQTFDPDARNGDHVVAGLPHNSRGPHDLRPAAVLVPLVPRGPTLTVLLTQRTEHLVHHPGQISFPGGRAEKHDAGPTATALREAEEEIGLAPAQVEILGYLNRYETITGFAVTPVVGFVRPPLALRPDPSEVAAAFEVPLGFILDPRNHRRDSRLVKGERREYYVLPYQNYYIWGATAAMLVDFSHVLAGLLAHPYEAVTADC